MKLLFGNKIITATEAGGPIYRVKYAVFVFSRIKRHFTGQGGVFRLFVTILTPPKIGFYLLGDVAKSIRGDLYGVGTPFIDQVWRKNKGILLC